MLMFSMSFSYFIKPSLKSYGSHKEYDDMFLTITGSIAFLVSAIAKFAWGAIQDKLGFKKCYFIMLCVQLGITFSFEYLPPSKPLFMIWVVMTFICEGAHFVFFPALASSIYGPS